MFAGHETTAKMVSSSIRSSSFISFSPTVDICPMGAREEASKSTKTSRGDHGDARENQGQG